MIENLEPRMLLSSAESASAQLQLLSTTGTAAQPVYHYNITLTNKGTNAIGTFWFAWIPGEDTLPSSPITETSPAGWTSTVTGSGDTSDGSAILWKLGTGTALAGGKSLSGFAFSTTASPAMLAGKSPDFPSSPAMISTIYGGAPFSDAGFQFVVAPVVVTPPPPVFNSVVIADRAALNTTLLKFKTDYLAASNKLMADAGTIKADDAKQSKTIVSLITKLDSDIKAAQTALQADHFADSALVVSDEAAVSADELKVIADKSNATLEAADKGKLKAARVKLQADLLAQLTARITVRQTQTNQIATDAKNLLTAIGIGASATPALKAAVTKFTTDKTAAAATLGADLTKLVSERTKLTADLTAEQSS